MDKTEQPLVTVLTPAYNRAHYLHETIQSVLSQDYPRIEYIVLDDGSKDNTRALLEQYNGRLIWESHPNMGETRTVNKGFKMARGELVVVVNSDDSLLPGAITTAVNFMQAHPDVLVGYPDWCQIDTKSERLGQALVLEYSYRQMLANHHCLPGPGAFIRRKAFELIGYRDEAFRFVADFDFWLRLGLHGPLARIPGFLANFRVHAESATEAQKGKQMTREHVDLVKKIYSLPNLPPEARQYRGEAFSWAHFVAHACCGNHKWLARWHMLCALWHCPRLHRERLGLANIRQRLATKLPEALLMRVRQALGLARRVKRKLFGVARG